MPIKEIDDVADDTRRLVLTTGDTLELRCEEESVAVFAGDEEVGRLNFRLYERPSSAYDTVTVSRLTHAFIEGHGGKYQGHGVGTEAVRFYLQSTAYELELPEDDGLQKDDGSHLVGSGPAFVASLRAKLARGDL